MAESSAEKKRRKKRQKAWRKYVRAKRKFEAKRKQMPILKLAKEDKKVQDLLRKYEEI